MQISQPVQMPVGQPGFVLIGVEVGARRKLRLQQLARHGRIDIFFVHQAVIRIMHARTVGGDQPGADAEHVADAFDITVMAPCGQHDRHAARLQLAQGGGGELIDRVVGIQQSAVKVGRDYLIHKAILLRKSGF